MEIYARQTYQGQSSFWHAICWPTNRYQLGHMQLWWTVD
jgi:hypothetical protein